MRAGTPVRVSEPDGLWSGRIVSLSVNPHDQPNGSARVRVTDPGDTNREPGQVVAVGTIRLTRAD